MRSVGISLAMLLCYFSLPLKVGELGTTLWLAVGLVAIAVLIAWQVRTIIRSPYPRLRAVEATFTTLPLFLLLFAATHFLLEQNIPGSYSLHFTRIDSLYFTLTVFSTVGFGDITPVSEVARVVVATQMVGDIIFVGLIARVLLGAVELGMSRQRAADSPGGPAGDRAPGDRSEEDW